MSIKIFTSFQEAQKITEVLKSEFPCSEDEDHKILLLELLVQKVLPLFQTDPFSPLPVQNGQSLKEFATHYISHCPLLGPFVGQFFPHLLLDKSTESDLSLTFESEEDADSFENICAAQKAANKAKRYFIKEQSSEVSSPKLLKALNAIADLFCDDPPFTARFPLQAQVQSFVFEHPLSYPFFVQIFPSLQSLEQRIDAAFEEGITVDQFSKILPSLYPILNTTEAFDLLLEKIDNHFPKVEQKGKVYHLLAKFFSEGNIGLLEQYIIDEVISNALFIVEVARVVYDEDKWGSFSFIKDYEIEEEEVRIEIAKLIAAEDGKAASACIQVLEIKSKEALIAIARIALKQSEQKALKFLGNFGLGEQTLISLLKEIAAIDGYRVSKEIGNYIFLDEKTRFEIALIALKQDPSAVIFFQNYGVDDEALLTAFSKAHGWDNFWPVAVAVLLKIKNLDNRKSTLRWAAHFLSRCADENVSANEFSLLIDSGFMHASISMAYRDPKMRDLLIEGMIAYAKNPAAQQCEKQLSTAKLPPHSKLPILLLSTTFTDKGLTVSDVHLETCKAHVQAVCSRDFKNAKNLRSYIHFLAMIWKTEALTLSQKHDLLKMILTQSELISSMQMAQAIVELGGISALRIGLLQKKAISTLFVDYLPITLTKNATKRFVEMFIEGERVLKDIFIYAAKLTTLEEKEAKKALKFFSSCVEAFLREEDSFKQKRYDLSASTHLNTIFATRPQLFKLWQEGAEAELNTCVANCNPKTTADFQRFFLHNSAHLNRLPLLAQYVEKKDLAAFTKEMALSQESAVPKSEAFYLLSVQQKCFELMNKPMGLEEQIKALSGLLNDLNHIKNLGELFKAVQDLHASLVKQMKDNEKWKHYKIVDTDDFVDLFLCGMVGGCQRVDGDPRMSKCLMAYVGDGKNRLLAIKNAQEEIVARQIFRILSSEAGPVLFLETLYPSAVAPELKSALIDFAKKRAESLGLRLATKSGKTGPFPLHSLGSPAPFEYFDSTGIEEGSIIEGPCKITKWKFLN